MRSFWISALASMAMAFAGPAASHAQGAVAPASEETQNFVRGFVRFLAYHCSPSATVRQIGKIA